MAPQERVPEALRMIICLLLAQAYIDEQIDEIDVELMHRSLSYALGEFRNKNIKNPGFDYDIDEQRYPALDEVIVSMISMTIARLNGNRELELAPNAWGRIESLLREGYRIDTGEKSRYLPACRQAVKYYIAQKRFESCDE